MLETNLLNSLLNEMPALIYWVGIDLQPLGCNVQFSTFTHTPPNTHNKRALTNWFDKNHEFTDLWKANNSQSMTNLLSRKIKEPFPTPTNQHANYESYKLPIKTNKGQIIGLLNISTKIATTQKQTKKEDLEIALNVLLSYIPGHVYWQDKNGIILGCNEKQAVSLGFSTSKDVIGKHPNELIPKKESEKLMTTLNKVMSTGQYLEAEETITFNKTTADLLSYKVPLKSKHGDTQGVLGLSIDISKQKEAERQLLKEKRKAELSDQLKTAFIQNMEHDIRTPISGIFGLAESLFSRERDENKKQALAMVSQAAKELLDYCNGLLDFTKLEAGPQPVTEKQFSIHNLIDSIIKLEMPTANQKQLKFTHTISDNFPNIILSDEFRIRRILLNLIGNALKFTQSGSINIHVKKAAALKNRYFVMELIVQDTGIGIAEDKQNLVYQKYVKVSPSNKGLYKGTGLGLSMVQQFIAELDGEIQLESQMGVGSTFTLLIPVRYSLSEGKIES